MQTHANSHAAGTSIGWAFCRARDEAKRLGAHMLAFLTICADAYRAAAEYEELSKLSKQELERRGIRGGDLPQHIFEALTKR